MPGWSWWRRGGLRVKCPRRPERGLALSVGMDHLISWVREEKANVGVGSEKAMAPYSSTLAWKIPWMEEPGRLQSWGRWESGRTEQLHFHFSLSCIGEGNGNPLQCSCLENLRDGGAWWAAVYGVAQSRTWLKRLSSSSSRCRVVDLMAKEYRDSSLIGSLFLVKYREGRDITFEYEKADWDVSVLWRNSEILGGLVCLLVFCSFFPWKFYNELNPPASSKFLKEVFFIIYCYTSINMQTDKRKKL